MQRQFRLAGNAGHVFSYETGIIQSSTDYKRESINICLASAN